MSLLTIFYEDGTSVELDIKAKHLLAAEARFPDFDHTKKFASSFQIAYVAARRDAGETRSWDDWLDSVERVVMAGEVPAATADPSPTSPPSPPDTA